MPHSKCSPCCRCTAAARPALAFFQPLPSPVACLQDVRVGHPLQRLLPHVPAAGRAAARALPAAAHAALRGAAPLGRCVPASSAAKTCCYTLGQHQAHALPAVACLAAACPLGDAHRLPPPQPRALLCAALWAVGTSYYFYITFLGYSALPFLEKTEVGGGKQSRAACC